MARNNINSTINSAELFECLVFVKYIFEQVGNGFPSNVLLCFEHWKVGLATTTDVNNLRKIMMSFLVMVMMFGSFVFLLVICL